MTSTVVKGYTARLSYKYKVNVSKIVFNWVINERTNTMIKPYQETLTKLGFLGNDRVRLLGLIQIG